MKIVARRTAVAFSAVTALVTALATPAAATTPGVEPAVVNGAADPGAAVVVQKTVHTPAIPPKPDVVLLVDTTGSMGSAIANVRANLHTVIANVRASQPTAQFAVASYRDEGDGGELFRVRQDLTADEDDLQSAVDALVVGGGGDLPEAWVNGLYQVSTGAIHYREDSSRIVVLVGDAPSHDPSAGHTLADAITELHADEARVVAVNVAALDSGHQATDVTAATGGSLVPVDGDVSAAILAGLHDLDVTVQPQVTSCDGLTATFDHASVTVPSGGDALFAETFTVAADAPQGTTLHCTVTFTLNGAPGGDAFVQHVSINVNDVTAPVSTCTPSTNPSGNTPASNNPDGFYSIGSTDAVDSAVDVYIHDTGSSAVFGPYRSGTRIKLVQAPGATPTVKPGTGAVNYHVTLKGDARIIGVDDSHNASAPVTCTVPPKK